MEMGGNVYGETGLLHHGDRVGLACCSNGLSEGDKASLELLKEKLALMGLEAVESPFLYRRETVFSGTGRERAHALMDFYRDETVKAVFDISGGDMANEILDELDFKMISASDKIFYGYSDLTTVINAIYTKTGKKSGLYQLRNLVESCGGKQAREFRETMMEGGSSLKHFNCRFLRGSRMEGTVVGGNIRCFLKLAGTAFWPDFKGKVLFLECNGGQVPQVVTYFSQLKQMGVFNQVSGILLGTFTAMENKKLAPTAEELLLNVVRPELPVAKTSGIGHGDDSRCLMIGEHMRIQKGCGLT